jgi:hypothetical protein
VGTSLTPAFRSLASATSSLTDNLVPASKRLDGVVGDTESAALRKNPRLAMKPGFVAGFCNETRQRNSEPDGSRRPHFPLSAPADRRRALQFNGVLQENALQCNDTRPDARNPLTD